MKFFIPAWFNQDQWWRDLNSPFYDKQHDSEFDDMVSLMNMYTKNNQPFELIQLGYHSAFRSFLYRNRLYDVDFWSVFDEIQGFQHATPRALTFESFNWPAETEFVYSLFIIKAYYKNQCTNIYYNEMGYLTWMEVFLDDCLQTRLIFDDRGILSSVISFKNGSPSEQSYLDLHGNSVMKENLVTNHVCVYKKGFKYTDYHNMSTVIEEVTAKRYEQVLNMHIIAAADKRYDEMIERTFGAKEISYSIFKKRNLDIAMNFLQDKKRLIVDTKETERLLNSATEQKVLRITPFATEFTPSTSSQYYVDYIGIFIDGMTDDRLFHLINRLENYLLQSAKFKLVLISRYGKEKRTSAVQSLIAEINDRFIKQEVDFEDFLEEEVEEKETIKFEYVPHEIDIKRVISKLRIMIDLSEEPDLYLQISSVSAGIPQINSCETDYVTHQINGYVIPDDAHLEEALDYYLKRLKQWNQSVNHCYQLIGKYSSENIVQRINHFIEGEIDGEKI